MNTPLRLATFHFGRGATTFAPDLPRVVVGAPPKCDLGVAA